MDKLRRQMLDRLTGAFGLDAGLSQAASTALVAANKKQIEEDMASLERLKVESRELLDQARRSGTVRTPFSDKIRNAIRDATSGVHTPATGGAFLYRFATDAPQSPLPAGVALAENGDPAVVFADQMPELTFMSRPSGRINKAESAKALANLQVYCSYGAAPDYLVGVGGVGSQVAQFLKDRLDWRETEVVVWDKDMATPSPVTGPAVAGKRVLFIDGVVENAEVLNQVHELKTNGPSEAYIGYAAIAASSAVYSVPLDIDLYSPIVATTVGKIDLPWSGEGTYDHFQGKHVFGDSTSTVMLPDKQIDTIVESIYLDMSSKFESDQ
ncbi:MAG: hypothetical protein ACT4O6_16660 [Reyranella sp.]